MAYDLEPAVYATLQGASAVTALVSDRCYPGLAPEDSVMPYVVYEEQGQETTQTIDGGSVGLNAQSLRVDCYADSRPAARGLSRAVKAAVLAMSGDVASVPVRGAFLDDEDADVVPPDGEGPPTHRVGMDFSVWYYPG